MKRKIFLAATAALALLLAAACGKKNEQEIPPENIVQEENTQAHSKDVGQDAQQDETQSDGTIEDPGEQELEKQVSGNDLLAGGSTEELIYEIEYENYSYEAEDQTAIFEVRLAYPKLVGDTEGARAMNSFFERWRDEKLQEYETHEDSTCRQALEVYRESRDFGWPGPWSEEYEVTDVRAKNGYISVLLDSYLYEGQSSGTPYRESFLFRKSDGEQVSLMRESVLEEAEWKRMLEEKFEHLVREAKEGEYYSDAPAIIAETDWEQVGAYFGDGGVVFYLPPYEIGPYSSGYAEVTASYEEIFGER